MKVVLVRFEKDKIHYLECEIISGNLVVGTKDKIKLGNTRSEGEKYNRILDELSHFRIEKPTDCFSFQPAPPNLRGKIDEIRFANEAMLNLYCYREGIKIFPLSKKIIRSALGLSQKELDKQLSDSSDIISETYAIAKSDKLFDSFLFLYMLRVTF